MQAGSAVAGRLGTVEAIDAYRLDALAVGRRIVYDVAAHPELVSVLPEFAGAWPDRFRRGRPALLKSGSTR